MATDYYALLKIRRDATQDEVKRAYRRNRLWKPRMGIMNAWERHLARPRPQLKAVA